jgi:hypothetical protein
MSTNFYYDQEDHLRHRQIGKVENSSSPRGGAWLRYCNMVIGVYAAISKELGLPLRFPGPEGAYRALYQLTSAEILARAAVWGGETPAAQNEIYNITKADCSAGSSCGRRSRSSQH